MLSLNKASAFRTGMLYGALLAAVIFLLSVIQAKWDLANSTLIINIFEIVTLLALSFIAGFVATGQSGRVRDGLVAGLWTGLIGVAGFIVESSVGFGLLYLHEDFGVVISEIISQFIYPPPTLSLSFSAE